MNGIAQASAAADRSVWPFGMHGLLPPSQKRRRSPDLTNYVSEIATDVMS